MRFNAYLIFWITIPFILVFTDWNSNSAIDIALHDTYFVISKAHISLTFSLFCSFFGMCYWAFRKRNLIQWMSLFHVVSTLMFVAIILLLSDGLINTSPIFKWFYLIIFIFILGQIVFLLNLIISFYKYTMQLIK